MPPPPNDEDYHNPPTAEYVKFLLIDVAVVLGVVTVTVAGTLAMLTLFGVAK
jgi:hypothetical protein